MFAPASVSDYRRLARRRLPRMMFDYVDGGAFEEVTLRANRADLQRLTLKQKVLCDVSTLDTATTLFGQNLSLPLVLAPIGFAGMMARRGEAQAARAAEKIGIPFTLSTVGICPIAEVKQATTQPFWCQLYMMKDRGVVQEILARAAEANCGALVFTVDLPVLGTRYRDIRNGMGVRLSATLQTQTCLEFCQPSALGLRRGLDGTAPQPRKPAWRRERCGLAERFVGMDNDGARSERDLERFGMDTRVVEGTADFERRARCR